MSKPKMPEDIEKWPAIIAEFLSNREGINRLRFLEYCGVNENTHKFALLHWLNGDGWIHKDSINQVVDFEKLKAELIKYGLTETETKVPQ